LVQAVAVEALDWEMEAMEEMVEPGQFMFGNGEEEKQ
jgi:hypothetical protein